MYSGEASLISFFVVVVLEIFKADVLVKDTVTDTALEVEPGTGAGGLAVGKGDGSGASL